MNEIKQSPAPGVRLLKLHGETVRFELFLSDNIAGNAWVRTNIGNVGIKYDEVIRHYEQDEAISGRDWHDIPMQRIDEKHFVLDICLPETGVFAAKTFFIPADGKEPEWPDGNNTVIKVESADYGYANTVYNAFVRQFSPVGRSGYNIPPGMPECVARLDSEGFSVIPPSGTFRDLIGELDLIMNRMGFRIIQLLPIFPVPTTFARMGRFGSPYASLDFFDVDPSLAEFDRHTTPLEQFGELVDAVHIRNGRVVLDIPINHTGWASWLQNHHPEWFVREEDKSFRSPGAWGVTWEDLSELDYSKMELWHYIADVFLFWCEHGVDGFRCDAGYMIPTRVWEYIIARVRNVYPDALFLLEGLGGDFNITETLLENVGLDWAYSELFQNYDRNAVEGYLRFALAKSSVIGRLINFSETHDNDRLAKRSREYSYMRTALAALCSSAGAFGITNGVEWFADEKINVHGSSSLRWGAEDNQVDKIAVLNRILATHPAFSASAETAFIHFRGTGEAIALKRFYSGNDNDVLILINLNDKAHSDVAWQEKDFPAAGVVNLLNDSLPEIKCSGGRCECRLAPAAVYCLALKSLEDVSSDISRNKQRAVAKIAELTNCDAITAEITPDDFLNNPYICCTRKDNGYTPVINWNWPTDRHRCVMIPPHHLLLVKCPFAFDLFLRRGDTIIRFERSIVDLHGNSFILFVPLPTPETAEKYTMEFRVYEDGVCKRVCAELLQLPEIANSMVRKRVSRNDVKENNLYAICTNGRGALSQVNGDWGKIQSQYDAILAANLNSDYPVDRHIMFTRCRAWMVYRDYSQELNLDCLNNFTAITDNVVEWDMTIPCGMGHTVRLCARLILIKEKNAVELSFRRVPWSNNKCLPDDMPIKLILRPDIEDRNFHTVTKAIHGAERDFPKAVIVEDDGFVFAPAEERKMKIILPGGKFVSEPEWNYMVAHPVEAERGLDGSSDLFSPGYFTVDIAGGESAALLAGVGEDMPDVSVGYKYNYIANADIPLIVAAREAIDAFIVKRDESLTVIAGYPWFLDWGRDTLICLRGILAAGMQKESEDILWQFARFEKNGTLPNMIRGDDDSNRDTSDAPLWFIVACADLCRQVESFNFMDMDCGGRTIRDVVKSIITGYMSGTPNGIKMDDESGLIFSPSHFTWMDTNHPAGTPREGYPIEIQALWYAGLVFMSELEPEADTWSAMSEKVRQSIITMYRNNDDIGLSDCLHTRGFQPAKDAVPDDALRPNQLFAVTLGAINDDVLCRSILQACECLLVAGAIRSLADRPVTYPLEIKGTDGRLLNDPYHPYWGHYRGDEDTRRKPAYHNGTAWSWVFPSYCEALMMVYGAGAKDAAAALLGSSAVVINDGCIGQVPEIIDGNSPHLQRGCGAQAWGATELLRIGLMVDTDG